VDIRLRPGNALVGARIADLSARCAEAEEEVRHERREETAEGGSGRPAYVGGGQHFYAGQDPTERIRKRLYTLDANCNAVEGNNQDVPQTDQRPSHAFWIFAAHPNLIATAAPDYDYRLNRVRSTFKLDFYPVTPLRR
jgi:hypothetical protein